MDRNFYDQPRVFVLGFEGFSIYYLPESRQVISRLDVRRPAKPARPDSRSAASREANR